LDDSRFLPCLFRRFCLDAENTPIIRPQGIQNALHDVIKIDPLSFDPGHPDTHSKALCGPDGMGNIMLICQESDQGFESGIFVISGINEFLSLCGPYCPD